jgi:hypothetical protein
VIVHLDLPWNPARVEQREGRARRLGSRFDTIHVYTLVPPVAAERMLELERRLRGKLRVAHALVGATGNPFWSVADAEPSASGLAEMLRQRVRAWRETDVAEGQGLCIAAARSRAHGWIAAVIVHGAPRIIAGVRGEVIEDAQELIELIGQIGAPQSAPADRAAQAVDEIRSWLASRRATAGAGAQSAAKRAVLDRLTQTVARAPRHRWSSVVSRAQRTRSALAEVTGVGSEKVLAALARSADDDDAWLASVESFGQTHAAIAPPGETDAIIAVILLGGSTAADATPG